jgi:hypothetical protein
LGASDNVNAYGAPSAHPQHLGQDTAGRKIAELDCHA